MRKLLLILCCLPSMQMTAQEEKFRVCFNEGNPLTFSVNDIKEITFVEDLNPLDIEGEWFNEEVEKSGTYESIEFREDGTLMYCPYWVHYHFGNTLPGFYNFENYMLTTQINGVGTIVYPVINHSENSYTIALGGSNSIYYKVQKVYEKKLNDDVFSIGNEGDSIIFTDNEFIALENNKIKLLKAGSGYALVEDSLLNTIVAYRVNVESVVKVEDWTQYFKKTQGDIKAAFGEPLMLQPSEYADYLWYMGVDPSFSYMIFGFDKESGEMNSFQGVFNSDKEWESYKSGIEEEYIKDEENSTSTEFYFYDTDNLLTASVIIHYDVVNMIISYMYMER